MRIYRFGSDGADGNASMKELLGGKGANLAEMCGIGLTVPPGFTLPTTIAQQGLESDEAKAELRALIDEGLGFLEEAQGKRFGDADDPLLVSVRSGAPASMPGMMDTVLNLGLNRDIAARWAEVTQNPRFVYDAFRRLLHMFGDVVLELTTPDHDPFEDLLDEAKAAAGVTTDVDLDADALKSLCTRYESYIADHASRPMPDAPREQLVMAVASVFKSWNNPRALVYRGLNHIPAHWGTACNVQTMVFGDRSDESATGVCFTRNPATGEGGVYGEWLQNAQGEDVVAGIRTPGPLSGQSADGAPPSLEMVFPKLHGELLAACARLENHFADMQDIEFTIEEGKLWILQTRTGKRTAEASVRMAVEMVDEGLIDEDTALMRVRPAAIEELLHPRISDAARKRAHDEGRVLVTGLPASPGAGAGHLVFSPDEAEAKAAAGEAVVLVRTETSADDIHGMNAAQAIVTARGGMTSHAAVVARGMGTPAVVGCADLTVKLAERSLEAGGRRMSAGEWVTVDGSTGTVFEGELEREEPELTGALSTFLGWADARRRLGVRANADQPEDARLARRLGAEGIGLCRTEHMFFEPERIVAVREMILAETEADRDAALAKLLPMQRADFEGLFEAMDGSTVTIRLLDPPLHEFLPKSRDEAQAVADDLGVSLESVLEASEHHHEQNPMLGHRGVRLAVTYPEIARMQARAILEAALACRSRGANTHVEVMVPLVADVSELRLIKGVIDETAASVFEAAGAKVDYKVGTMIELPRAALTADRIAEEAEFFSFGTNDLTQTTFGLSRDDAGVFLRDYIDEGLLKRDPFESLDVDGVGQLIIMATQLGRATRTDLHVGLCGEQGGEAASIAFCHRAGLDYVSCSPFRVPSARLAAAQAALEES